LPKNLKRKVPHGSPRRKWEDDNKVVPNSVRVFSGFINIRKGTSGDYSEHGTERLERKYTGNS